MSEWFCGGDRVDSMPIDDRAAQYGDGLFETIAIRKGKPRLWPLHRERLLTSCDRLGLPMPDPEVVHAELLTALAATDIDTGHAAAKIMVSAGIGPRGYRRADNPAATVRIGLFDAQPLARKSYRDGIRSRICQTRLAPQLRLAGMKTLNRLEQVLARAEWTDPDIREGLMVDPEERLICGTMSNVFVVVDQSLATPAITRCGVSGVMRRHLLAELRQQNIECAVRDIELSEALAAQEVFVTNSQLGVVPVRQIESRDYPVGDVTRRVMRIAADSGIAECAI